MGQNIDKILEVFYENPGKTFTIRELAKLTKVPRATVHKKLLELKKEGLISKENRAGDGLLFEVRKINYFVEKIVDSGLINELVEKLNPSAMVLFGSIRKGDSVKESDIDIFVESFSKKEIGLANYEKKLGHKIDLFVYEHISDVNENLRGNIINGIKLYGYLDIFR